jgi:hypothetical protein
MEKVKEKGGRPGLGRELKLELIQTHMIQKPLLWVEVGKSACGDLRIAPLSVYSILPAMPLTFGLYILLLYMSLIL